MLEKLVELKEELFDAPEDVKVAFNKIMRYFDGSSKVKFRGEYFYNSILVSFKVWNNYNDYEAKKPCDEDYKLYVDKSTPIGDVFDVIQYNPKFRHKVIVGPIIGAL